MRTITFEVDVDDEIILSLVPNIYEEVFKQAPHGQLFMYKDNTSEAKKLVRLHREAEEGGEEAPWFENIYLPNEMRIVGMTGGNAAEYVNGKSKLLEEIDAEQQEVSVSEKLDEIKRELSNLYSGLQHLGEVHNEAHKAVLLHFKQSHEQENWLQEHQSRAEDRLMNHIQECCDKATLTGNSVRNEIILALTNIEVRIKEYIGHPDPAQTSQTTDEVAPQALLKALEIVSRTILNSAKSE